MSSYSLILASASPRRRDLLESMGVPFGVSVSDIDENRNPGELAEDYVARLAREKAKVIDSTLSQDNTAVLAADTVVAKGDHVFGKPSDLEDAIQIWDALSSSQHSVMTAVCLWLDGRPNVRVAQTKVEFGPIRAEQMQRYWLSGEPQDKAGAYAIQGLASAWVKQIEGSYSNVVGLPLRETNELLALIDMNWL